MTKLIIALKNRFYKVLSISMCECEALRLFLFVEILLEKNHKHFFTLTNIYLSQYSSLREQAMTQRKLERMTAHTIKQNDLNIFVDE